MRIRKNILFWVVALGTLSLDRATKAWVMQTMTIGQTLPFWPGVFHFTYVTNTGAAFSLFTQGSGWLRWLSLAVSIGLMILAIWGPVLNRWEQAGYGFILGGALGNGLDRFAFGQVIDFLDFRLIQFPVFNLADISINLGLACLIMAALQRPSRSNSRFK
jgi:signal peptidase II